MIFEKAKKEYNSIMNGLGMEFLTIGTDFSENTDNWNIRDMVSECQYQLDVCYEANNANSEGRYIGEFMEMYGADYEEAKQVHDWWLEKTRCLRNFVKKYKKYIEDMKCATGHCSCWD